MEEDGASYRGVKTEFLHGEPLNVSAMRFGPDGHMYLLTGGRNTDSKLYRVRYVGAPEPGEGRRLLENQGLRDLRRSLERFHGIASAGGNGRDRGRTSGTPTAPCATPRGWRSRARTSRCGRTAR